MLSIKATGCRIDKKDVFVEVCIRIDNPEEINARMLANIQDNAIGIIVISKLFQEGILDRNILER